MVLSKRPVQSTDIALRDITKKVAVTFSTGPLVVIEGKVYYQILLQSYDNDW